MPTSSQIEVSGLDELNAALNNLSEALEKKILRKATRRAAILFRDAMRSMIPNNTHHRSKRPRLADDIKVRMKKAQQGQAIANIGPSKKTAFVANFLEFGTRPHMIKAEKGKALYIPGTGYVESIHHPGSPAKPFMRPAFDGQVEAVIDAIKSALARGIESMGRK